MKRYISMLLAALMVWTIAGCGSKAAQADQPDTAGTVQPGAAESDAAGQVQAGTEDTDGAQGSVNGGVYTNEFAGIGCRLDEGWVFYTAEQMAELNGALADGTDNADVNGDERGDPEPGAGAERWSARRSTRRSRRRRWQTR